MTYIPPFASRGPLIDHEMTALATYNAERARGLVHTPAWDEQMAALQQRFNDQMFPMPPTAPRRRWRS